MPFVTEELWDRSGFGEPYSLDPDGVAGASGGSGCRCGAVVELDWVVRLISDVRSVRTEMNVPPGTLTPILLRDASGETLARGQRWTEAIRRLARASELRRLDGAMPKGAAQVVLDEATVVLPLADVIDVGAERARLGKERDKAAGEARKVAQKLDNADFVRRAPEEVVEENRERLAAMQADIARLEAALQRLSRTVWRGGPLLPLPRGEGEWGDDLCPDLVLRALSSGRRLVPPALVGCCWCRSHAEPWASMWKQAIGAALSYLPSCVVAVWLYGRRGSIPWREAWFLCIAALPTAWLGARTVQYAPARLLMGAIGVLLLAGGICLPMPARLGWAHRTLGKPTPAGAWRGHGVPGGADRRWRSLRAVAGSAAAGHAGAAGDRAGDDHRVAHFRAGQHREPAFGDAGYLAGGDAGRDPDDRHRDWHTDRARLATASPASSAGLGCGDRRSRDAFAHRIFVNGNQDI